MNNGPISLPIFELKNVTLSFGSKLILRDLNFTLWDLKKPDLIAGQVITLLGRSGIGKTQLMKMIARLQAPTSGEINIWNEKVTVGMVMQSYPLFEHKTVRSNLSLVCEDKEKIAAFCNTFDMADHIEKYPAQLSGGQRQRAAIIQQLLTGSKIILLDEPFSGLDPVATDKLSLNIRKIADLDEENTIIVSTHILEPAIAVSDIVLMLGREEGKEGATIVKEYDLIEMGLDWSTDIRHNPQFSLFCNEIRDNFHKFN